MSKIEKIDKFSLLFDFYKNLLTETQKNTFTKYFLEDYSLSELAEFNHSSKASVADSLNQVEKKLLNLEDKLNFVKKYKQLNSLIKELEDKKNFDIANKLKEIYE